MITFWFNGIITCIVRINSVRLDQDHFKGNCGRTCTRNPSLDSSSFPLPLFLLPSYLSFCSGETLRSLGVRRGGGRLEGATGKDKARFYGQPRHQRFPLAIEVSIHLATTIPNKDFHNKPMTLWNQTGLVKELVRQASPEKKNVDQQFCTYTSSHTGNIWRPYHLLETLTF